VDVKREFDQAELDPHSRDISYSFHGTRGSQTQATTSNEEAKYQRVKHQVDANTVGVGGCAPFQKYSDGVMCKFVNDKCDADKDVAYGAGRVSEAHPWSARHGNNEGHGASVKEQKSFEGMGHLVEYMVYRHVQHGHHGGDMTSAEALDASELRRDSQQEKSALVRKIAEVSAKDVAVNETIGLSAETLSKEQDIDIGVVKKWETLSERTKRYNQFVAHHDKVKPFVGQPPASWLKAKPLISYAATLQEFDSNWRPTTTNEAVEFLGSIDENTTSNGGSGRASTYGRPHDQSRIVDVSYQQQEEQQMEGTTTPVPETDETNQQFGSEHPVDTVAVQTGAGCDVAHEEQDHPDLNTLRHAETVENHAGRRSRPFRYCRKPVYLNQYVCVCRKMPKSMRKPGKYPCKRCALTFTRRANLKRHVQSIHGDTTSQGSDLNEKREHAAGQTGQSRTAPPTLLAGKSVVMLTNTTGHVDIAVSDEQLRQVAESILTLGPAEGLSTLAQKLARAHGLSVSAARIAAVVGRTVAASVAAMNSEGPTAKLMMQEWARLSESQAPNTDLTPSCEEPANKRSRKDSTSASSSYSESGSESSEPDCDEGIQESKNAGETEGQLEEGRTQARDIQIASHAFDSSDSDSTDAGGSANIPPYTDIVTVSTVAGNSETGVTESLEMASMRNEMRELKGAIQMLLERATKKKCKKDPSFLSLFLPTSE